MNIYNRVFGWGIAQCSLMSAVLFMLFLACSVAVFVEQVSAEDMTDDSPDLRSEWFTFQRAYPNETIPAGAVYNARMFVQHSLQNIKADSPAIPGYQWQQIGPAPTGTMAGHGGPTTGRIRSIAVQDSSTVYVGAASGGVWKSSNGGDNWTPLTDNQASLAMGSVAIDPSNFNIIYVGTGEYAGGWGHGEAGLLKSTDGGLHWIHIPGRWDVNDKDYQSRPISKILVIAGPDPADPDDDIVFVAGSHNMYRSEVGGTDFTNLSLSVLQGNVSDVVVDPDNSQILYAAVNGTGIYRSVNQGQSWDYDPATPSTVDPLWIPPSGECAVFRGALAIAPTNPNILYAAFETDPRNCIDSSGRAANGLIFKTTDAGGIAPAFTQMPTPRYPAGHVWHDSDWCRGQCWYDLAIIVTPVDPDGTGPLKPEDIVYTGGVGFFRSTDGGNTWTNLGEPGSAPTAWVHVDLHAFAFDETGALYVGSDGGIYRHPSPASATSYDENWGQGTLNNTLNTNLAITQFYPGVSLNPNTVSAGSTLILGGAQDNGSQRYQGQLLWDSLTGGDGGHSAFDFTHPATWYVSVNHEIHKTTNDGPNLARAMNGFVQNNPLDAPFIMCPNNSQVLIASNNRGVWRTDDGADNWYTNSLYLSSHDIEALAFVPGTNCQTYFAAGANHLGPVSRTTSGGGYDADDWTNIGGGLPNRFPTALAADPTLDGTLYVTFSGYCGDYATCPLNQGHVWVTENALDSTPTNVTWTDLTGGKGLPNTPVNAIAIDAMDSNRLYIGTDLGVYRSLDAGTTWQRFTNGLPNVIVTDIVLNSDTQTLVAATYGRSMFQLKGAVYVDINWNGCENGTYQCPYNTLEEGVAAVPSGGDLLLKVGTYPNNGTLPISISKPLTIRNYEGPASIGSP